MTGRAYLSIGDVLTLLREEFPDVTISKIRFLESQGLVNPERTPSGYRKFYEPDVERLRWVLRQQREHFLPLKVIKGRLEQDTGGKGNGRHHPLDVPPAEATVRVDTTAAEPEPALVGGEARPGTSAPASAKRGTRGQPLPGFESARGGQASTGAAPAPAAAVELEQAPTPEEVPTGAAPAARPPRPARPARPDGPAKPAAVLAEQHMTLDELTAASGCAPAVLGGLESYGLVSGRTVGGVAYYDDDALAVARLAAAFAAFGVEPRHLRLHKHAVDREAGFVEQVVLPLLKQRNPEARQRAHDVAEELTRLGQELRAVLLRRALRDQLGG